jgi:prepilin-type N-terminal cleavage/methylation domain-containing protein
VTHGPPDPKRSGFSLVELMVVVLVVGLLAGIAIPNFQQALLKARAADAIADLQVIRVAVYAYVGDNYTWPADVSRGAVPAGLAEYLPENFAFSNEHYVIDYDNWSNQAQGFVGLSVITTEVGLGPVVVDMLQPNAWTNGSDRFTWVIEWTK